MYWTTIEVGLTIEAYTPVMPCTCPCKPTQQRLCVRLHSWRILSDTKLILVSLIIPEAMAEPLTIGSHSANARALVVLRSVSSSLLESAFMKVKWTAFDNSTRFRTAIQSADQIAFFVEGAAQVPIHYMT
jgi:hypothetical protein